MGADMSHNPVVAGLEIRRRGNSVVRCIYEVPTFAV